MLALLVVLGSLVISPAGGPDCSCGLGVPALLWEPSSATASFPGSLSPESPWGLGDSAQGCKTN